MISGKALKGCFLTTAVCLAGLSASNFTTSAANNGVEDRLFKKVEIAAQQGQLKEAKTDIQRVLKLNPRHRGAIFYAGQYSFECGNYDNAEKFLQRITTDPIYGSRASRYLADIRLNRYKKKFKETLEIYLAGESFAPALTLCEEALEDMPDNEEILLKASYIATMMGIQSRAVKYAKVYEVHATRAESAAELNTFIDAWFSDGYDPEVALERLMTITDRNLVTAPVRRKIKDLIVSTKSIDKFEIFIKREKSIPGADTGSLERELISFLIEQNHFEKALELIKRRPVDSVDDNILYIKVLSLTGQEKKAMSTARQLMSASNQDLRPYQAWVDAWTTFVAKNQAPPDGNDDGGKSFIEMADEILDRLKPDKLVNLNPELLINLLRVATAVENEQQMKALQPHILRITLNKELADLLMKTCDDLLAFDKTSIAIDLLESSRNQLPENYDLHIKLAEMHLTTRPEVSTKILEAVLEEKPDLLRAFLLWTHCMSLSGKSDAAEMAILKKLQQSDLSDIARRQLTAKLEVIRMQSFPGSDESNDELTDQENIKASPENQQEETETTEAPEIATE
ncbi:MAG: hypothetical protein EOM80_02410 [Erysipelotrichia bacterium]|nr:hypothetical protein [Erysipelotrichia bacterium]